MNPYLASSQLCESMNISHQLHLGYSPLKGSFFLTVNDDESGKTGHSLGRRKYTPP